MELGAICGAAAIGGVLAGVADGSLWQMSLIAGACTFLGGAAAIGFMRWRGRNA